MHVNMSETDEKTTNDSMYVPQNAFICFKDFIGWNTAIIYSVFSTELNSDSAGYKHASAGNSSSANWCVSDKRLLLLLSKETISKCI